MDKSLIRDFYSLSLVEENKEVGIEIEMEGKGLTLDRNIIPSWEQTRDGSLRGEGIEYKFRTSVSSKKILPKLLELQDASKVAKKCKWSPSSRCGVHIHINCQHMNHDEVLNFACLYLLVESVLINWCEEERHGNLFCLDAVNAEGLTYQLIGAVRDGNFNRLMNDVFRYASLNFTSLSRFGSLEFRGLETPKNIRKINKWVKLLLRVKDVSKSFSNPMDMVVQSSSQGHNNFLRNIMGPYYSWVACEEQESLLVKGIRTVQDVAYLSIPEDLQAAPQQFLRNNINSRNPEDQFRRMAEEIGLIHSPPERPIAWEEEIEGVQRNIRRRT